MSGIEDFEIRDLFLQIEDQLPMQEAIPELAQSLDDALDKANKLIPSEAGSIYLYNNKTEELVIAVCFGDQAGNLKSTAIPKNKGLAGYCFENGSVISNDVRNDSRFYNRIDTKTAFQTRSVLCTPLIVRNQNLGVMQLLNKKAAFDDDKPRYSQRDLEIINILAQLVTQSIQNATMASKDDLTGLYNSRSLHERLSHEVDLFNKTKLEFCVLFLDLDYFKLVNDRFGHLVGSMTLAEVAKLLKGNTRRNDFLARFGGDEFTIILPNTTLEEGFQVAEKIRRKVDESVFLAKEGFNITHLTCSIGCASSRFTGADKELLMKLADKAMYQAKEHRNRVVIMDAKDVEQVKSKSLHPPAAAGQT